VWESQQILLDYGEIERNPERDAGQALSSVSQIVFGATPPSWFTATCRLGSPIQALIQESERAEMLIVGSRRRNRFWAALTGSVSASCAAGAHCPVLITRGGQSAGDPAAA
jgi:nucleotide-binding universal stress UspA family protein